MMFTMFINQFNDDVTESNSNGCNNPNLEPVVNKTF